MFPAAVSDIAAAIEDQEQQDLSKQENREIDKTKTEEAEDFMVEK